MQSLIKSVELDGGVKLPYIEQGLSTGVPVILLHGVADSHRSWDLVRRYLPADIRAFAISQRGHGDASKPRSAYDAIELAEDLREFMDAVGLETASIVGHSMGSFVAQRFAIDNPDRIDSLTLIGSFATCMDNQGVIEFTAKEISNLTDPISEEFVREFQTSTVSGNVDGEHFETAIRESLKVPSYVWKSACESMIAIDHTDELSRITTRTLLIWGDQDAYFDYTEQRRLLNGIKDAQLKTYTGVGHSPNWEYPERVAADVSSFIEKNVTKPKRESVAV